MAQIIAENLEFRDRTATEGEVNGICASVYWCSQCHVPLLSQVQCPVCHSQPRRCARDLKPVFPKEKAQYETLLGRTLPDFLFANKNRVYFDGRLLFAFTTEATEGLRITVDKSSILKNSESTIYGRDYSLRQWEVCLRANQPALAILEAEAIHFIQEVAARFSNRTPIVAFSGGKDSAVTAMVAQKALGAVPLLFGDTTLEFPTTYDYIGRFAELYGFQLFQEKPDLDFFELCQALEPPSRIMRWCCTVCKSRPINSFYGRLARDVLSFDGIRRMESNSRADYPRVAQIQKFGRQIVARPILGWSSFSVWLYLFQYGIEYNPLYDYGYGRVGCMYCPSNTPYNDYLTSQHFPEAFERWQEYLLKYAKAAGKTDPIGYVLNGFWKLRRIGKVREFVVEQTRSCEQAKETVYTFEEPLQDEILDFLRPLGKVTTFGPSESSGFIVGSSNPFVATGSFGHTGLAVTFGSQENRLTRQRFEKQLEKYLNCVHCGGCVGVCMNGAISIRGGKYHIDEMLCTRCGRCTTTKYLKEGCVALNFSANRKTIRKE